ncbi:uncharacterized protein LOC110843088 [Folsomia candida]|uniref:Protein trunk n=1 Tax=Folsomia candida TaxID=158441 RepID=A0A226F327_FOLCA|nr:uncharacterized protein LOC110843088 [Folsomia candida]XP_035702397.1 uncharacterized protein LOC110843088 [Folsomia candida]OXA64189.1 Protein trunk [Folsomia candida]
MAYRWGNTLRRGRRFPDICTPKALIVIALILCWRNGSNADNHHKNLRLRAPPSYLGPLDSSFKDGIGPSDENGIIGPFVGNIADAEETLHSPKRKKDCGGMPSIAARGLVGPTLKRAFFAATREEMEGKMQEETREKREVKRSETNNEPSLPWTCETKYEWRDHGADHYPRFIRTADCKTRSCFNGFFRCRPRRYKTKVLKRVSPSDSTSCEEDDVSLPESLRSQWRFITVTISLCCDCVGRIPGAVEV